MNIPFDGDALSILYIINKDLEEAANRVFNPRNAMFISRNDGMMNDNFNHQRDAMVLLNALININADKYTSDELAEIADCVASVD